MAAIVNDRDLLLQAAASRLVQVPLPDNVIVPGLANIRIVGNANFFTLDANGGPASPASITMTLVMTAVVGVVTWSVIVGSATLTGSGLSRTITAATGGMGTNFVTVRASVTYNGITYTADYSISVVTNGSSGVRGVVHLYGTAAFWSDTAANNLILSLTGSATKQWGDTVTFSNDAGFASTRFWNTNTATWIVVERTIDGSMLVQGAIYAGSGIIGALAVTSAHIAASLESDNWSSSGGTDG